MSFLSAIYTIPNTFLGCAIATTKLCIAVHVFSSYIGWFHETYGPSMLPTSNVRGDFYWVNRLYRRGRGIQTGDMISFRHPLVPSEGASKRVLGMPGDWIAVDAGIVNGEGRMMKIPEGHCWVEGDHSAWSRDSKVYGPIPLALIRGKVQARVWPWSQQKLMRNALDSQG